MHGPPATVHRKHIQGERAGAKTPSHMRCIRFYMRFFSTVNALLSAGRGVDLFTARTSRFETLRGKNYAKNGTVKLTSCKRT